MKNIRNYVLALLSLACIASRSVMAAAETTAAPVAPVVTPAPETPAAVTTTPAAATTASQTASATNAAAAKDIFACAQDIVNTPKNDNKKLDVAMNAMEKAIAAKRVDGKNLFSRGTSAVFSRWMLTNAALVALGAAASWAYANFMPLQPADVDEADVLSN